MELFSYMPTAIVVLMCIVLAFFSLRKIVKDNRKGGHCQGCCSNCPKTQVKYQPQVDSKQGCGSCKSDEKK